MPAASDAAGGAPVPTLPQRYRPLGVRFATVLFAVILYGTLSAVWILFEEHTRDAFTITQRLTLLLFGIAIALILHALGRCRVDATEAGLVVVNGYRTRVLEWTEVVRLSLRPGAPWLVLDLSDGTSCAAMGIQGSDGVRARRAVGELAALVEERSRPHG